jgi:two-component system chemotaxis sensor kinase CheA
MVDLCHLTENIFDKLRRNELQLNASIMDAILEATGVVRIMFDDLQRGAQLQPASSALLASLRAVISGETPAAPVKVVAKVVAAPVAVTTQHSPHVRAGAAGEPDWEAFFHSVTAPPPTAPPRDPAKPHGRRASDDPAAEPAVTGRRSSDRVAVAQRETTIRIDTSRLDHVLNLSGELGLAKNRLNCLRHDMVSGR